MNAMKERWSMKRNLLPVNTMEGHLVQKEEVSKQPQETMVSDEQMNRGAWGEGAFWREASGFCLSVDTLSWRTFCPTVTHAGMLRKKTFPSAMFRYGVDRQVFTCARFFFLRRHDS